MGSSRIYLPKDPSNPRILDLPVILRNIQVAEILLLSKIELVWSAPPAGELRRS